MMLSRTSGPGVPTQKDFDPTSAPVLPTFRKPRKVGQPTFILISKNPWAKVGQLPETWSINSVCSIRAWQWYEYNRPRFENHLEE
jgi:hypothetical protein